MAAVLFDMDGLLVRTEELWYEVETEIMNRRGGVWDFSKHRALAGSTLDGAAEFMARAGHLDVEPAVVLTEMVEGMERLLWRGPIRLMPGAEDLLDDLVRAGVPTALVSASFRCLVDAVLAGIGEDRFLTTVAGDEVLQGKPDPEPYLLAARDLGVRPQACVVLEDSANGARAGVAAGCVTVLVPGTPAMPVVPGTSVVATLTELDTGTLDALVRATVERTA
jgi:HAD superfamily hydrolase (TIGR01509 family)